MKSTRDRFQTATKKQVEELRRLAVLDLEEAGYSSPGERAIASRLNTLAAESHLLLPGTGAPEKATRRTTDEFSPGLALVTAILPGRVTQGGYENPPEEGGTDGS